MDVHDPLDVLYNVQEDVLRPLHVVYNVGRVRDKKAHEESTLEDHFPLNDDFHKNLEKLNQNLRKFIISESEDAC